MSTIAEPTIYAESDQPSEGQYTFMPNLTNSLKVSRGYYGHDPLLTVTVPCSLCVMIWLEQLSPKKVDVGAGCRFLPSLMVT